MNPDDFSFGWQDEFLAELTLKPRYMTEVRRDGKDHKLVSTIIKVCCTLP